MKAREVSKAALEALARHPMRSVISMLSIGIGVGSFICSVAVGEGASARVQQQIRDLGVNLVWIEAGGRSVNGMRTGPHGTDSLTIRDVRALAEQVPLLTRLSPHCDTHVHVVSQNQNWNTQVRGVSPDYLAIRRWQLERGSCFTEDDVERGAKVCLLGRTVADHLFVGENPVGRVIRVQRLPGFISSTNSAASFFSSSGL